MSNKMRSGTVAWWMFFILVHSSFILCLTGCQLIGVAAHALPAPTIPAEYTGLAGQSVGVMVWADRGVRIDWPNLQVDLANAVEKKLMAEKKAKSVLGATYPVEPASIVRYQLDHPEVGAEPVTDVAPQLGVTRLIYIELDDFATRSDMSVDLFRGHAKGTVRVIEVNKEANGTVAKVVYEHANVTAHFPPKGPAEGVPGGGDAKMYAGTLDALAIEIVHLFVPWQAED